jgi:CheY-like chemotaxis protein
MSDILVSLARPGARVPRQLGQLLEGRSVLLVEDEALVSFHVEDMLRDLGCRDIWHAATVREALALLGRCRPDMAVLDVNLSGEMVFPVAERLRRAGVPFVFATGYGRRGLPEPWAQCPVLQKPFDADALSATLADARGAGR